MGVVSLGHIPSQEQGTGCGEDVLYYRRIWEEGDEVGTYVRPVERFMPARMVETGMGSVYV